MDLRKTKLIAAVLLSAVFLVGSTSSALPARADQFDAQINALNAQIAQNQAVVNQKRAEANTLANKLAILQGQINVAQQALNLTSLQISQTQAEIDKANADLDHQKSILKDNLRLVYKQGEVSPLELIASSKNLSDFVAQNQYLNAIKDKINQNLRKIDELKDELNKKQGELNTKSLQQQTQVSNINAQKAEQQDLYNKTKGEEANYQKLISADSASAASLRAQQAAANAALAQSVNYGGGGGPSGSGGACDNGHGNGGYAGASGPAGNVCNAAQDSITDWAGWPNRECTSYAYWYFVRVEGRSLNVRGNAKDWVSAANSATPHVGDIAVYTGGFFGHVMIVQEIRGSSVLVSSMNRDFYGHFGYDLWPISALRFIH